MDNQRVRLAAASAATACAAAALSVLHFSISKKRGRRHPQYCRAALLRPIPSAANTPWRRILTFGKPGDFIVSINITKDVLLTRVLPLFEVQRLKLNFGSPYRCGPKTRGRRTLLESIDILGLSLWFLKSRDPLYKLCPLFGVVTSSATVWLDYALAVLLRVVRKKRNTDFEIRWPTHDEMRVSSALLERNREYGPLLHGVFAVADGGRMPCATYTDEFLQNAYWEGFTQADEVTNLLVMNFHGELIHAGINYPGSWHDSKVAAYSGLYYPRLSDEMTPAGYCILVDSAFPRYGGDLRGKLVRARKDNERNDIPAAASLAAVDALIEKAMPSERQSAEWGVRALKGPFKRLSVALPADAYKRYRIIRVCCHLFNLRARFVGLNQLRTVYADVGSQVQPWVLEL